MNRAAAKVFFLFLVGVTWTNVSAWAQLDPSSSILLRNGSREPRPDDLDTQRYKVRETRSRDPAPDFEEEKSGTKIPTPVSSKTSVTSEPTPKSQEPSEPSKPQEVTSSATPQEAQPSNENRPPLTTQVKELILGGTEEDISEYRKQIHPQDPRANLVELTLAPVYYYNDSSSRYSFHRFNSHGLGFQVGAHFWLTPFFGIVGSSFSSLAGSVPSGAANAVLADYQIVDAGFRFRRHFGWSRKAASLRFGVDYHQSEMKIGQDATDLVGTQTKGASLAIEGNIPSSHVYVHTFALELRPRLRQSELVSGANIRSGTKSQTHGLGASVGGQWLLDRQNQIFWKLHHSVEQSLYDGEASSPDPMTGVTPRGVSITNSFTRFSVGFSWGT